MRLSVVIVNYNVRAFLEQALLSVRKAMQGIAGEVWVVDNHSVDDSVRMVREKFPEVRLIANTNNPGFAVANNQAIRQSKGEYVLLLNPDTLVEEDTFHKCLAFMDAHPEAGA
ncbi:MAG: glycosyltransferase, partial [Thermoanaerobaculia bacterium]|nr:glycosyltransferase [Thermoanaerobaculia bacterium]